MRILINASKGLQRMKTFKVNQLTSSSLKFTKIAATIFICMREISFWYLLSTIQKEPMLKENVELIKKPNYIIKQEKLHWY